MPLTIKPPHPPSPLSDTNYFSSQQQDSPHQDSAYDSVASPTSPDFSPITPKVDPILPVAIDAQNISTNVSPHIEQAIENGASQIEEPPAIAPTRHIAPPPPLPFSSDDSSDGLALRAAISSLQYQRQKAQNDIKSLEQIRSRALADPEAFAKELSAGKVKEKREHFGSLDDAMDDVEPQAQIPGPQSVVRMPHINWDKYHVVGEALDSLHEQQQRWPGSLPFDQQRGREHAVTAPYSAFHDLLDGQKQHSRNSSDTSKKDSLTSTSLVMTPTSLEHPYETRRSSSKYNV